MLPNRLNADGPSKLDVFGPPNRPVFDSTGASFVGCNGLLALPNALYNGGPALIPRNRPPPPV